MKGHADPDWCPGCGDFGVLHALKQAIVELGLYPHEVLTISGIGCSSNLPGYINTYGMHTLHGRSLAVATGAQLANHQLKVIVTGGDGDGYGIGGNHFLHTMRRNVDLTYIVMDNQIYGLTTGQVSPTSVKGMKTKSTPTGSVENPINPIPLAITGGRDVRRARVHRPGAAPDRADQGRHPASRLLADRLLQPVRHVQPRQHARVLQAAHAQARGRRRTTRPTSTAPWTAAYEWGEEIPIGLFWKRDDLPALDQLEPVLEAGPGCDAAAGR